MSNKLFFILLVINPWLVLGQDCNLTIDGEILDLNSGEPIIDANIYFENLGIGTASDENGRFSINELCPEEYHLTISHIGCETRKIYLKLEGDTLLNIKLDHDHHILSGIKIEGSTIPKTTEDIESIKGLSITDNISENISGQLEKIPGVSLLKNGSGLSKPIVQGLYGNRLTILNNGITQSGQQWGNDHSPEIDPLVANRISVIKGVSALEYLGSNLGSIVLVEPNTIPDDPHLHGRAILYYESNGNGNGANLQLSKKSKFLKWQLGGTIKKSGDRNTPDYFLTNTGSKEANFSFQAEKFISDKFKINMYLSSFNTEIGVLRGSHIGNLTDLEEAIGRPIPFFTEEDFSYKINAPKQQVNHHLAKIQSKYFISNSQWLDVKYAFQLNNRKEYDVRRADRSEIPALSLNQKSHFIDMKYQGEYDYGYTVKSGLQFNYIDNTNNPETGILPLIPDYTSAEFGTYMILEKEINKSLLEIGLRYDGLIRKVATISQTLPYEILRYNNNYGGISTSLGYNYFFNNHLTISINSGYAIRQPAINELYSGGLHQGVSGIELGDPDLTKEKSLKSNINILTKVNQHIDFKALFYYQHVEDYIYLNPLKEYRLTIRGAYPVYQYTQTDARIMGSDFTLNIDINRFIGLDFKYSYIYGKNLTDDTPIINLPATNFLNTIHFNLPQSIKLGKKKIENISLGIESRYVFEKPDEFSALEYIAPPDDYFLLGLKLGMEMQLKNSRLRLVLKSENIINQVYRDYLNRQRYFADDLGKNTTFSIKVDF